MKKVNIKSITTAVSLLVILVFVSIMAYFTSSDAVTNRFTAGNLEVVIDEGSYKDGQTIGYAQLVSKAPKVKNDGKTDAIVFLEVKIPKRTGLKIVDSEGNLELKEANEAVELFSTHYNNEVYNKNDWILLKSEIDNTKDGYNTYIYGCKTVVTSKGESKVLFNSVQFINLFEIDENDNQLKDLLNKAQNIDITAYGIQSKELSDANGKLELLPGDSDADKANKLKRAWKLLKGE